MPQMAFSFRLGVLSYARILSKQVIQVWQFSIKRPCFLLMFFFEEAFPAQVSKSIQLHK